MILGTGIDIEMISRFDSPSKSEHFMHRLFTEAELFELAQKKFMLQEIAALFSAKESVSKSFGTGISGFWFTDIEILHDSLGKPYVNLYRGAKEIFDKKNASALYISISHCQEYVVSQAILEK